MRNEFFELLKGNMHIDRTHMKTINVVAVTNITLELYFYPYLTKVFTEHNCLTHLSSISYVDCFNEADILKKADVVLVWIDLGTLYPELFNDLLLGKKSSDEILHTLSETFINLLIHIRKQTNASTQWLSFVDPPCMSSIFGSVIHQFQIADRLNKILHYENETSIIMLDLWGIFARIGSQNVYNTKVQNRWNCPYGAELMKEVAIQVYKQYALEHEAKKKCLVLDCDNVLWGGILSEDGFEKIVLGDVGWGRTFQVFQRYVLSLHYLGIILAVCSKNDLNDVRKVFQNHSAMLLKEEHIACFQVNWNTKSSNIAAISKTLGIGLDSMVFVDDLAAELMEVHSVLPDVTTLLYDDDIIEKLSIFGISPHVDMHTVKERNQTYLTNCKRLELESVSADHESYLHALDMKLDIKLATLEDYQRIAELSQRTNRLTNGRRYTVSELKNRVNEIKYVLYAVYLSDRFGDLGLVGAIGMMEGSLDLFCLSCRALGRNIENKMMQMCVKQHRLQACYFLSTGKNDTLRDLLREYSLA